VLPPARPSEPNRIVGVAILTGNVGKPSIDVSFHSTSRSAATSDVVADACDVRTSRRYLASMDKTAEVLVRLREERARLAGELAGIDRAIAALEAATPEPPPAPAPPAPAASPLLPCCRRRVR
jgi:hypothetical protein